MGDGQAVSYPQFARRVASMAGALGALAPSGAPVALVMPTSLRLLEMYFAPLWAGQVTAPLNTRWTASEMRAALKLVRPGAVVVDGALLDDVARILDSEEELASVPRIAVGDAPQGWLAYEALMTAAPAEIAERDAQDPACLFFTSGSSGTLKAATLTHANLTLNALGAVHAFSLDRSCVQLHAQPLFHLAGGARVFNLTLAGGGHVALEKFTPEGVLAAIEAERVTHLGVVPTMLAMLLNHPDWSRRDVSSLRVVGYGAAPMPIALMEQALGRLPQVRFVQSYGMTELSPVATCLSQDDHVAAAQRPERLRSVGQPVFNVEVSIRDREGRPVETGAQGEIWVRGPTVMRGYWNDPDATRAAIKDGWMRTGDAGRLEVDGYLYLADRLKDIIISGGENVASVEVEDVLYRAAGVRECAVIARPHPLWGEAVHAVVVSETLSARDASALDAHCRASLAGFKIPRSWDIRKEALPRNSVGKVLKHELRAQLLLQPPAES